MLEWLLERIDELKKRAYLAKYLVKVDIPPEVAADPDVADIYDQVQSPQISPQNVINNEALIVV